MKKKRDYDVAIIGSGIGGLVCGCYLAKAGLKTAIIEKHHSPGGYCTSFKRRGYRFDTSVHYIGGIKKGALSEILMNLEMETSLKFHQDDPSDGIFLPDTSTYIRANSQDTIKEFKKSFPSESKDIERFFRFIMQNDIASIYRKTIEITLEELLNDFFSDTNLRATIGIPFLGNMGLPPGKISAFAAIVFFREFLLDPGYYPVGGMQAFADCLANRFKGYGGDLVLSKEISKIILNNNVAEGVVTSSGKEIKSKFVVSNIDATRTFKHLIKSKTKEALVVDKMVPSNSIFAVYVGLKRTFKDSFKNLYDTWLFKNYDLNDSYKYLTKNIAEGQISGVMVSFPSFKDLSFTKTSKFTAEIFTMAPYVSENFWAINQELVTEAVLNFVDENIPGFKKYVDFKLVATPHTYYRYTMNREGAAFGWASIINQIKSSLLPQVSSVKNLFVVGHWCTMGTGQGGVSTVALAGKKVYERITNLLL
ncbi:MAG: NAD(P)/FAD-dependent oxidoreductase [Candidatus Omnitrophica bacterium]|nr:NAD(P)/FAD-dependent oxidoreductase [Candidatus Omnitrophota bacterium]MDD5430412.1 NAD(P)/FAD-dependent oxidoreductase [Candidatus Omnitrophota bacterium]